MNLNISITDYKSLQRAKAELETEVLYHKAAMELELNKAISNISYANLLFNGLKSLGKTSETATINPTLKVLIGNFFSGIVNKLLVPERQPSKARIILTSMLKSIFFKKKEDIVTRVFNFIANRLKK